jgi:ribonuclease HI
MAKPSRKWYVVWHGHKPGVYDSWDETRRQVEGVPGATYKSFPSRAEADTAFLQGASAILSAPRPTRPAARKATSTAPIVPSVSVDAACNMTTGVMEYRGVDTASGAEIFRMGPFSDSTNNIGEFLAVVHALSLLHRTQSSVPVYTDSRTALSWVRNRHAKTTVDRTPGNEPVFALIARAEVWLKAHSYPNKVLKWETEDWGENPADFGRK